MRMRSCVLRLRSYFRLYGHFSERPMPVVLSNLLSRANKLKRFCHSRSHRSMVVRRGTGTYGFLKLKVIFVIHVTEPQLIIELKMALLSRP